MPLPHPHPDLDALDLLVSVSKFGSISAAARAHHVTQPAASMRLRALEGLLQVTLLERSKRGTGLTAAGAAVVEWSTTVLEDVRILSDRTAALRADRSARVRVAASMTVAEYMVPGWLQELGRRFPGAQVSLDMGNTAHVVELVSDRASDVGFIEGPEPPEHLEWMHVTHDELVVVVGRRHPWARQKCPLAPQDLATTPLVLRERGSGTREVLEEALAKHRLALMPAMELGSTTAIKAAVAAGTGSAVVSARTVTNELRSGELISLQCSGLNLRRMIRAIWLPRDRPVGVVGTLIAIASQPFTTREKAVRSRQALSGAKVSPSH